LGAGEQITFHSKENEREREKTNVRDKEGKEKETKKDICFCYIFNQSNQDDLLEQEYFILLTLRILDVF